jgi:U3 small nucleolar ribonucleoprotein protein LCP5
LTTLLNDVVAFVHMETTQEDTVKVLDEMTASVSAAREVIKELITRCVARCHTCVSRSCIVRRNENSELDSKDGISLLSMKCHLMLSYLHSLTLLGAHRVLGHSLGERNPPTANFSEANRQKRGSNAGDLIDALVQDRLVLEKVKGLEGRMKYQIDKLLRMADEEARTGTIREDGMSNFHFLLKNFASYSHKIHWHSALIPGTSPTTLMR